MKTATMILTCCALLLGCDKSERPPRSGTPRAIPTPSDPTAGWTEHKTAEFTLEAPRAPRVTHTSVPSAIGPWATTTYDYTAGHDQTQGMMLMVADRPAQARGADPAVMLDGGRDGILAQMNAKLVDQTAVELGPHPGLDLSIEARDPELGDLVGHVRLVVTNDKVIQIIHLVRAAAAADYQAQGDAFIGSLVLN